MTYATNKVHGKSFVLFGGDVQRINALERMLFFAGATVQAATTAEKGINFLRNVRPDIVIIDDTVTDLSMTDIANTISSDTLIKNIPIIIIAEDANRSLYETLFKEVPHRYVSQVNFDVLRLVHEIEVILQKVTSGQETVFDFSESDHLIEKIGAVHHVKLLLVEDDPLLRNLLSIRLQKSAIEHEFCHSGTTAMEHLRTYKPTVLILDLMLPGKNGLEILEEVRADVDFKDIPVIIFSNKDDDNERARAKSLGVDDFMVKATTDLSSLIARIVTLAN